MKNIKFTLIFSLFIALGMAACNTQNTQVTAQNKDVEEIEGKNSKSGKTQILVELFTSEGCSSCPPADRLLAQLQKEQPEKTAEIITLAFHVDYWNYLGWKDEFSSEKYSQRQNNYSNALRLNSNYTPQMIVDGSDQFVGSREITARKAISDAAKDKKAIAEMNLQDSTLQVNFDEISVSEDSDILLAIAEDDLETNVKRGENSGRTLKHVAVVRNFQSIGEISATDSKFSKDLKINLKPNWKKENLRIVAFIQGKTSKKIFGLGQIKYGEGK